jgi:hypothetical protein
MKNKTNTAVLQLLVSLREQFATSRSITSAINSSTPTDKLLAQLSRDAAYREVLEALELGLKEIMHVPDDLQGAPEASGAPVDLRNVSLEDYFTSL